MRKRREKIRLGRPDIEKDDIRSVASILATGMLVQGPVVEAFESKLAGMLGAPHGVAVSSGTAALHLALKAVGVEPGDDVVVPAFTFPATANVVEWLGARPVFCDIAPGSFNAGPEQFASVLTRRTRAVMVVHAFGSLADVPAITTAVRRTTRHRRGAQAVPAVVEDAACALGSSLRGTPAGMLGRVGCFSFHPRKIMTTGEGGLVVTAGKAIARRVRAMRSHGLLRTSGRWRLSEPGLNYRMTDFQAALGLAQLARLDALLIRRRRQSEIYRKALGHIEGMCIVPRFSDRIEVPQSFVLMFSTPALRRRVEAAMGRARIETTFGTHCVPMLDWYRRRYGFNRRMFPNACAARDRSLTLPLHASMTPDDQERVIACITDTLT